jgi:hypothetical protein
MFKSKMAVYAFIGAVCAMFLTQPAFADTAKKIDVEATGEIEELQSGGTYNRTNTKVNINIKNSQNINTGDYIDLKFESLNDAGLENKDIRYKDIIIGKMKLIKAKNNVGDFSRRSIKGHPEAEDIIPEKSTARDSEYRLIFNDQAKKFPNMELSIDIINYNYAAWVNHKYNVEQAVKVNDKEIAHKTGTIIGDNKKLPAVDFRFNIFHASSQDGENLNGSIFDFGLMQSDKNNPKHIKPGDIVKMKLPQSSGVAFDTKLNPKEGVVSTINTQELYANYGDNVTSKGVLLKTGVNLKYKVIKNSSYELVYQIVEIADDKAFYQFLPRLTILDTSEKTINYNENKLNPISATTEIYRGDDKYFSLDKTAAGAISGAKMKSYSDIKKRGSVIVRYQDENGTSLAPEVLLENKVQVGTDYAAEEKQFEGFEKAELLKDSSPKTGKVEEGVKIVTFVYKKKSVPAPAPEKPSNPVKEEKKPKENISAPNTGFENNFIKNLLFMGGAILSVISIIVIRKNY